MLTLLQHRKFGRIGRSHSLQLRHSVGCVNLLPRAPRQQKTQASTPLSVRLAAHSIDVRKASPHHHGDVSLHCPHQGDHPPNHRPAQKEIQQHDRRNIPFAPRQSNDRRQKIHHKPKSEERQEKTRQEVRHKSLLNNHSLALQPLCFEARCCVIRADPHKSVAKHFTAASPASAPVPYPAPPLFPSADDKTPHPTDIAPTSHPRETPAPPG